MIDSQKRLFKKEYSTELLAIAIGDMVHDLGILVALLPDDSYPPNGFNLSELNPYASIRRYEEGQLALSRDEIDASLQAAQDVVEWAKKLIE